MTRLEAAVAELVAAIREEAGAAPAAAPIDRLLDVEEAATMLRSIKVGRRRLIPSSAIADYIAERARS
jgi:hypothetical protein